MMVRSNVETTRQSGKEKGMMKTKTKKQEQLSRNPDSSASRSTTKALHGCWRKATKDVRKQQHSD
jgi:hypothetical protein